MKSISSCLVSISRALLFLSFLALCGCMSLPGVKTEMVGRRRVEYVLSRQEGPTVVFENGLGGKLQCWSKAFPEIAKGATAFAYNRPGTGASDVATTPRDGEHVVAELRSLLRSKGLAPPYILVGHSLGGLYMQYFARRYPSEVVGLVLVDSTQPRQFQGACAKENWLGWFRTLVGVALSAASEEELKAANSTGEQVLNLPAPPNVPVIFLTATEPSNHDSDLARDAIAKRKDIARLFPGSRQIWVKGGHVIPLEHPEAVIEAIREVARLRAMPEASPPGEDLPHCDGERLAVP